MVRVRHSPAVDETVGQEGALDAVAGEVGELLLQPAEVPAAEGDVAGRFQPPLSLLTHGDRPPVPGGEIRSDDVEAVGQRSPPHETEVREHEPTVDAHL